MKNLIDFIKSLQFIFRPNYWIMNEKYSKNWDTELNTLLDEFEFTDVGEFCANLGHIDIWIVNHPYACFVPYDNFRKGKFRASRLTILRAKKKLDSVYKSPKIKDPYQPLTA